MKSLEHDIKKMEQNNKELKQKVEADKTQFEQYKRLTEGKMEKLNEQS